MMTYNDFIEDIVSHRGVGSKKPDDGQYYEVHHIKPRAWGGNDDECNLVCLLAREHYAAHRLLAIENPDNAAMCHAWWMMAHITDSYGRDYDVSAEEYEEAKILAAKHMRELHLGKTLSEEQRKKISDGNKGKVITEEHKLAISKANSGTGNPMYGKKGNLNPFFGKHHTQEYIDRVSGKNNPMWGKVSRCATPAYCNELDMFFCSAYEGGKYVGLKNPNNVTRALRGERKTVGKHPITGEPLTWRRATEEEIKIHNLRDDLEVAM